MKQSFPRELEAAVSAAADEWTRNGNTERFWNRDASLWTNADESKWMGWIDIAERQLGQRDRLRKVAEHVKKLGLKNAVLLGMGGSSLCPEVLSVTFGQQDGFPGAARARFHRSGAGEGDRGSWPIRRHRCTSCRANPAARWSRTFSSSISSRSPGRDGSAVHCDYGSGFEDAEGGRSGSVRMICYGDPAIGGRYSALSDFGMVPARRWASISQGFWSAPSRWRKHCREPDAAKNPGVALGLALGTLAKHGRDKVTLIASPAIYDLGAWLEQLIAESTGKIGKALIPVDREPLGAPEVYGQDRVFVYIRYTPEPDAAQDDGDERARDAPGSRWSGSTCGHVRSGRGVLPLGDRHGGGGRGDRHQSVRPAGCGSEQDRDAEADDEFEKTGTLPAEQPILEADGIKFFTDATNAAAAEGKTAVEILRAHLNRLGRGRLLRAARLYPDERGA